MSQPFFIGYLPKMPQAYAAVVRTSAISFALLAAVAMGVLAAAQGRVDAGAYEFGVLKSFEGVLLTEPIPLLRETTDGQNYVLVGFGKAGISADVRAKSGARVSFQGSLVKRGSQVMIEMNSPETFKVLDPAPRDVGAPPTKQIGRITLRGEIVDTKCFFGVMRPALGKVHRACAIRCLSGGVPAGLRVFDGEGHESIFLLAGKPGEELALDVQLAGVSVEATGNVELMGNVAVLRVETVRRVRE